MTTFVPYGDQMIQLEEFHYPSVETHTCPICKAECHSDPDGGDWYYSGTQHWLESEGDGPNGLWYCSDSCRSQAMFQALTLEQREALRELTLFAARADGIAKRLGLDLDDGNWSTAPQHPLFRWLSDDKNILNTLNAGRAAYDDLLGTEDNNQPEWVNDAVNGK